MNRHILGTLALVAGIVGVADGAWAQTPARVDQAVVNVAAPVFLLPDATRTPLRTLNPGTQVRIAELRDGWVQVTFNDPVLGQRVGWMERRAVTLAKPTLPPEPPPAVGAQAPKPRLDPPATGRSAVVSPRVARRATVLSVRGFGSFSFDKGSAAESLSAVLGSDSIRSYGGGVQGAGLWHGLFAEVSVERSREIGERVFVFGGEVYQLGIPLKVTQMPIDVVGGWHFLSASPVTPFVGAGLTYMRYEETSDLPEPEDDLVVRKPGVVALAGMEASAARWFHVRAEVRFRSVGSILGSGGASGELGEDRLGGFGGSVKLVFGR